MNRAEAFKVGQIIADRWWKYYKPTMLSRQNIERQKAWRGIS